LSRVRLRLTLALAILEQVRNGSFTPARVKRELTRDILTTYGIRKNTEIKIHDYVVACSRAIKLRGSDNTRSILRQVKDDPTSKRVNKVFGIG